MLLETKLALIFSGKRSSAPALFAGYSAISERSPRPRGQSDSGDWRLPFERPRTAAKAAAFREPSQDSFCRRSESRRHAAAPLGPR